MVVDMRKCSSGEFLELKHSGSLSESFITASCQQPDSYFLPFQLGFGSFLGIIGAHLIENKRQMVRAFITLTSRQSSGHQAAPRPPVASPELHYARPDRGRDPLGPAAAANPNKSPGLRAGRVWK